MKGLGVDVFQSLIFFSRTASDIPYGPYGPFHGDKFKYGIPVYRFKCGDDKVNGHPPVFRRAKYWHCNRVGNLCALL